MEPGPHGCCCRLYFFLLAQIKPFQERKANSFDNKHALSPAAEQSRVPGLCLETLNWRDRFEAKMRHDVWGFWQGGWFCSSNCGCCSCDVETCLLETTFHRWLNSHQMVTAFICYWAPFPDAALGWTPQYSIVSPEPNASCFVHTEL